MSSEVFPALPGIVFEEREPFFGTETYVSPGSYEQRVSRMAEKRWRWRGRGIVRDTVAAPAPWNPYSELGALLWFLDRHKGAGESFLFDDPQARKNLLTYSQDLSQAGWTKNTGVTVTPDSVAAPDGTTTADSVVYGGTGVAGDVRLYRFVDSPSVNGQAYTASAWLRAAAPLTVRLSTNIAPHATCALTTSWQRFTSSGTGNGSTNVGALIMSDVADNAAWTIYAWGVQFERASSAALYVPTGAVAETGRTRVRFDEDSLSLRRVRQQWYEVELELVSVLGET